MRDISTAGTGAGSMIDSMARYFRNLFRPWKIVLWGVGTAYYIWGAYHYALPTWDVGVAVIMSLLCYLFAPMAIGMAMIGIMEKKGRARYLRMAASAAIIYFIGSGSYEIYNTIKLGYHPPTYWENLFYSIPVTIIAGLLWQFEGSLKDLFAAIGRVLSSRP